MISEKKVHEYGFVRLLEVMGSDQTIEESARMSYGEGTRPVSQTRNLLRYLMRHKHTSPFEMAEVRFHLKLPIFVMRQLVRHRTANLNEYSGRYSVMSDEFYVPEDGYIQKQSRDNKQGRTEDLPQKGLIKYEFNRLFDNAQHAYNNLLSMELTRELSRAVLPVSNYTEVIWKSDLHNFFHMIKLRADSHAQQEIQDYANVMYELVKPHFPISSEAWEDYSRDAVTFSGPEMKFLMEWVIGDFKDEVCWNELVVDGYFDEMIGNEEKPQKEPISLEYAEELLCEEYNLSKRELIELKNKLGAHKR